MRRFDCQTVTTDGVSFQFTHPGRGATLAELFEAIGRGVSIHAPREGCDMSSLICVLRCVSFNSRTPGGVRLQTQVWIRTLEEFQFTHPGRGATAVVTPRPTPPRGFNSRTPGGVRPLSSRDTALMPCVSIHAPREGCDTREDGLRWDNLMFQFKQPGRSATHNNKNLMRRHRSIK